MCYVTALIPLCKVKLKIKQLQSQNVVRLHQTNGHPKALFVVSVRNEVGQIVL